MQRPKNNSIKRRSLGLALFLITVFTAYSIRLFQIQIVEGEAYAQMASKNESINVPIQASRGEILDRYLKPMAVNRTSFSIVFDKAFFPTGSSADQQKLQNDIILSLTELLGKTHCQWNDTLPISEAAPYSFLQERENSIKSLKSLIKMADYATADQCMKQLVKRYCLAGYKEEHQRIITGVRYEIETRKFSYQNPFTFSSDVSEEAYNIILENSAKYPGVNVQTTPVREYVSKRVGAHLLGTVGPIYAEEYAELKDQGYLLNDIVGKNGIESALEKELRGVNGVDTVIKDSKGIVVEKKETLSPIPGNSVALTLDYNLQQVAQDALNEYIQKLKQVVSSKKEGQDVRSGSVVMLDVKTGGVLVSASWPDFDLSSYNKDYATLIGDKDKPLFNRALNGAFACGSTMKPGVALAGITEGLINRNSTPVSCHKEYTFYPDLTLYCMGSHGNINVVQALAQSCNVFFYDLGRRLGIDKMNQYSTLYGLGQKTGIEIGEAQGVLAGPAHSKAVGQIWYGGNTSTAAIGQSDNLFTPIQLAAYTMTIANDGVRYKTHLVKSIRSYDGTETVKQPEVAATVNLSKEAIDAVREGMVECVKSGTARKEFASANYSVAAKTGTAQITPAVSDHGVFIGYAPADKPEVAIAVVMENGNNPPMHPNNAIARKVLDAYFNSKSEGAPPTPQGVLLP